MNTNNKAARTVGLLFLAVGVASSANAASAFVFGPIEQVNSRFVTVLGQSYALNKATVSGSRFSVGTPVLVEGTSDRNGVLTARSVKLASSPYVPGATDVALSGVVSRYDASTGYLTIGGLTVYVLNATVSAPNLTNVGTEIEVVGRQALPLGPLWATDIRAVVRTNAISPVALQGIEGTGRSLQGIEGTGLATQGIEGTGRSAQGIEGTGRSVQGIEGTGRSLQGIEGTGLATQGIEGTGHSAQGIEGTGLATQGIEGTGRSVQGIEGTGRSLQGIEGTGLGTQGIEGTGRSAQGIEGTGLATQGIEGTGRSVQGIEGTGRAAI